LSDYLLPGGISQEADRFNLHDTLNVDSEIPDSVIAKATRIITQTIFPGEPVPETFTLEFHGNSKVVTAYAYCPDWVEGSPDGMDEDQDAIAEDAIPVLHPPTQSLLDLCTTLLVTGILHTHVNVTLDKRKY
jgi:hypothetical protein